jgi:CheY-like chemotaxis protein
MRFLIIDDCPSRYDEFTRMLDREKIGWVITCEPEFVENIMDNTDFDGILLDHDMPKWDGRQVTRWLTDPNYENELLNLLYKIRPYNIPVIITSTTGLEGVREEMLATLQSAGFPSIINPADHIGCETEWLSWMKGCLAGMGQDETR